MVCLFSTVVSISQREVEFATTCHCFQQRLMLISHLIKLVNAATAVVGQDQRASFQRIFPRRALFMKGDLREKIGSFGLGTSFQLGILVLTLYIIVLKLYREREIDIGITTGFEPSIGQNMAWQLRQEIVEIYAF